MGEKLILRFDEIGSFLFMEVCPPYARQDSNEIGECVVARFNPTTGEMESVEVLFFDSWLKKYGEIRVPVSTVLWPANAAPQTMTAPTSMDATLTIRYGQADDTLILEQRSPYRGQCETEIVKDATARLNPETGIIESLEIRRFKARAERDGEIVLPIDATLRLAEAAVPAD